MDRIRAMIRGWDGPGWIPLAAALALVACGGGGGAAADAGIDEQTFVSVFVELRRAASEEPTEESFSRRRDEILRSYRVTEDSLERFIDENADDLEYLSDVWDRIDRTLRGELDEAGDPAQAGPTDAEGDGVDS
ncbi:MAG TPA: hypothetical protein VML95_04065 [Longimicrobiales bacterium]|nr:hypothetical protein [Longimicrobiales bacterium]